MRELIMRLVIGMLYVFYVPVPQTGTKIIIMRAITASMSFKVQRDSLQIGLYQNMLGYTSFKE